MTPEQLDSIREDIARKKTLIDQLRSNIDDEFNSGMQVARVKAYLWTIGRLKAEIAEQQSTLDQHAK